MENKYGIIENNDILNAIPDMLFIMTKEGVIIEHKGEKSNLYVETSKFIGKNFDEILPPDVANAIKEALKELETNNLNSIAIKYELTIGNNKNWYECRITKIAAGYLSIVRDITKLKEYEVETLNLLKEKESLLSELQHRTKNNIALIVSITRLYAPKHLCEYHNKIGAMIKSIADLYSFFNEQSFNKVNLKDYINNLLNNLALSLGDIKVQRKLEEITVSSKIAINIGLIINELLFNVIKYAFPEQKDKQVIITLKVSNIIELMVADNGIGIITEHKGMGFELVKGMTKTIGGKINYENNNGLTVTIIWGNK